MATVGGILFASAAHAANLPWTNAAGGNFGLASNWNSGVGPVPGAADTAQFNIAAAYTVNLDLSPSVFSANVNGSTVTFSNSTPGRTFNNSSTLVVNTGGFNLTAATPVAWTSGNTAFFNADVNVTNGNDLSVLILSLSGTKTATATFDGVGTTFAVSGNTGVGNGTNVVGTLNFSNGASGTLNGTVQLAADPLKTNSVSYLNVQSGASLTANEMNVGTSGVAGNVANVTVTGAGTSVLQGGGALTIGADANSLGTVTVGDGAAVTVNFSTVVRPTGELNVQSGGRLQTASLVTIESGTGTRGSIIIGGANSAVTQTGALSPLTVGSASGNTARLQVNAGGTYTTGTGSGANITTVNATGVIDINGGTFNGNTSINVNGGTLQRSNIGAFNWAAGKTMTVQNGGDVIISGSYALPTSATVNITGGLSTFAQAGVGTLRIGDGSQITLGGGGSLAAHEERIGVIGPAGGGSGAVNQSGGTHTISGGINPLRIAADVGSSGSYTLSGGALNVVNNDAGANGEAVGFNGAGTFTQTGGEHIVSGTNGNLVIGYASTGVGTYTISNGNLIANSLYVARDGGASGTLNVGDGAFVIVDKEFLDLGVLAGASGTVNANAGAVFTKGIFVGGTSSSAGGTGVLNVAGGNVGASPVAGLANSGQLRVWNTPGSAINLSAGSLSCDTLLTSGNPARFNWTGGNLYIQGSAGFDVSPAGPLGPNLTLGNGKQLIVTKKTHIAAGSSLAIVDAGVFMTGALAGAGSLSSNFNNMFIGGDNTSTTFTGSITGNGGIVKNGTGTLTVNNLRLGTLTINAGAIAVAPSGGAPSGVSRLNTLTINDGRFDLGDNKLVTNKPLGTFSGGAYSGIQGDIARAYNFGAWDTPGLTTSQELARQVSGPLGGTTTIAVNKASEVLFIGATDTAIFAGQTVTGASTIAMYTYAGDVNLDGLVDAADYGVIDNWIQFPGTDGYMNGDFNYDGVIDAADYGIIDNTIQLQGPPIPVNGASAGLAGVTAVPEPSACGVALSALAALASRRRRHRRHA